MSRPDPIATATATQARNCGIDALRGLAIVLVVLHHIGLRLPLRKGILADFVPLPLLNGLNYNGYEAVFVFFVLSGFLIATTSLQRWGSLDRIDTKAFYALRFARIVPCLLLLVGVLATLHLAGATDYVIEREGQSLPRAIAAALGLHLNWYEGATGYLPGGWDVLWSLSIEEVFYLAFPLLCLLVRRSGWLMCILLALALSLPYTHAALEGNEIWQEKAYLPGMAAIATGILAALFAVHVQARARAWLVRLLLALGSIGLTSVLFVEGWLWEGLGLGHGTQLVLTFATACLVIGLYWRGASGTSRTLRGLGWLRSFGRLSYEIYLTHMFVVFAFVAAFKASGGDQRYGFLWYLPAIPLTWLLGATLSRGFSIPCDQALRRLLLKQAVRADAIPISRTAEEMAT